MQYAPVIIPTLNRHEHFKRCLESLERCTGADRTEVYVALDFPPSDKYVEGWKKIDEYLKEKEQNNGFKELKVTRRETNFFLSGKYVYTGLLEEATKTIDCYITSEDDNEFSPCFLDFMNKALEKYRDNPKVYSVCGFIQPEYEVKGKDIVFLYDNSAWGFGRWTDRVKPDINYVKAKLRSPLALLKVGIRYPALIWSMLTMVKRNVLYGDACVSLYCICEEKYQIRPSFSLVRNTGDDGSGQHSNKSGKFSQQEISNATTFDFPDGIEPSRTKGIDRKVYLNMASPSLKGRIANHLRIIRNLVKYWISNK